MFDLSPCGKMSHSRRLQSNVCERVKLICAYRFIWHANTFILCIQWSQCAHLFSIHATIKRNKQSSIILSEYCCAVSIYIELDLVAMAMVDKLLFILYSYHGKSNVFHIRHQTKFIHCFWIANWEVYLWWNLIKLKFRILFHFEWFLFWASENKSIFEEQTMYIVHIYLLGGTCHNTKWDFKTVIYLNDVQCKKENCMKEARKLVHLLSWAHSFS